MDLERPDYFLGKFWDPTQPWRPRPGLLQGLATDKPLLRLIEALPDAPIGLEVDHQYPILCGRGDAGEVTILNCESLMRFPGQRGQNLWCQRVLTGGALAAKDLRFGSATVQISHLQEWAAKITPGPPSAGQDVYHTVAARAKVSGMTVELITGGTASWDARGTSPTRYAQMRLAFDRPRGLKSVDLYLKWLLDMVTFLTARPNYFQRVTFGKPTKRLAFEVSGRSRHYHIGVEAAVHHWTGMLLSTHEEKFEFAEFVPAWFALEARLGRASDWIFSSYYDEGVAAEEQFLHAAQSLEAGHHQITSASRRTLRQRYHDVLREVADFSVDLIPRPEPFISRCVDLRNSYAHWAEPHRKVRPPSVDELASLTVRLKLIFEAYLLLQLGFDASTVRQMSSRRAAYTRAVARAIPSR